MLYLLVNRHSQQIEIYSFTCSMLQVWHRIKTKKQIEDRPGNTFSDMYLVQAWSDVVMENDYIREYRNDISTWWSFLILFFLFFLSFLFYQLDLCLSVFYFSFIINEYKTIHYFGSVGSRSHFLINKFCLRKTKKYMKYMEGFSKNTNQACGFLFNIVVNHLFK